jgi:AcrR family transcriptional regulator
MSSVVRAEHRTLPAPIYRQLKPKRSSARNGSVREEVESNQRARLFAVMIDNVARRGYSATTIRELCALAGVSRATPYALFGSKEQLFLDTYDLVVRRAHKRVKTAYLAEPAWMDRLHSGLRVFLREVVEEPNAARLALVEALGAGPAALQRMERASKAFEQMVSSTFLASPDRIMLPPLIAKGIVGGMARVARQRLVDGRITELPDSIEELLQWMLAYHSPAGAALTGRPAKRPPANRSLASLCAPTDEERGRMLRAAMAVAAKHGYQNLTIDGIARGARVSIDTVFDAFDKGTEECFMEAYDIFGMAVATAAATATLPYTPWPDAVHAGLRALMSTLAGDPVFARIAFVEIFSVGPAGVAHRSQLIQSFRDLLMRRAPVGQRPPEIIAEAIVGAVWEIAHHYVVEDAIHRLPELADHAAYLVLAPAIGGDEAMNCIRRITTSAG